MNARRVIIPRIVAISCWLFKDKQYHYIEDGEYVNLLPTISIDHKHILEENSIPFRVTGDGNNLEYWSPECYEEFSVTLPLYVIYESNYRFIKQYTGNVVSEETTEEAFRFEKDVVKPLIEKEKKDKACQSLTNLLDNNPAIIISQQNCPTFFAHGSKTLLNGKTIYSFDFRVNYTWYYALFDMSKIKPYSTVELQVPAGIEGYVIGKNGWQVKDWSQALGISRINVVTKK